jgi:hypothetical protein
MFIKQILNKAPMRCARQGARLMRVDAAVVTAAPCRRWPQNGLKMPFISALLLD